ncbi:hypothetical protein AtNW77_Chr5g0102151 [Arabidopsis thaliana]
MFLFRGLLGAKKIIRFSIEATSKRPVSASRGFLAVYVGEDQPSFQALHRNSKEELGFDHPMGG